MRWRLRGFRFRRTTLLIAMYATFLVGVGQASQGHLVNPDWLWLLAGLLLIFRRRTVITLGLVVLLGLGLGIWRGSLFAEKLVLYAPYYEQKVTLTARAATDGIYGKGGQMSFDANEVRLEDGTELIGKIQLSGFGVNSVYQGDEIQATGKLFPGFGAYQGRMSYAQLVLVEHHPSLIADIRRRFSAGVGSALPEPVASFTMGLLIGQRATLPESTTDDLKKVGLTHIIAVSGYNLTIILRASKSLLAKQSKRLATGLSITLIISFLLMTGLSASIVRASIVSMLSIIAGYYGREFRPLALILLAASITAWANPLYVWSDLGWYLSFLAFYGVMVVAPALHARLHRAKELPMPAMVALESLAAEVTTLPYVLYKFGQMSFIGLAANVLVTTVVPLAMLLGAIAGLVGMLVSPLAGWVSWPAKIVLTYMLDIAHLLGSVPHGFTEGIGFTRTQMLISYAVVLAVVAAMQYKTGTKNDIITDKSKRNKKESYVERTQQMVNYQAAKGR